MNLAQVIGLAAHNLLLPPQRFVVAAPEPSSRAMPAGLMLIGLALANAVRAIQRA
jgi:hypothetical protein